MQNTISDYKDDITTGRKLDLIKVFGAVTIQAIKEKRAAYVNNYVCFILSIQGLYMIASTTTEELNWYANFPIILSNQFTISAMFPDFFTVNRFQ